MEYKIKSIDKYNQERYDATKNAAIAAIVTGTITTLLSFGNFGFSLDGIEEILRSIITAATSVGLAGSFLAMVKQFAKISKTEINIENIKMNNSLNNMETDKEERNYLIKKVKKYRRDDDKKTINVIESIAVALGIFVINKFGMYPIADNLDYGTIEQLVAQFGSGVLNVADFFVLGMGAKALADKANLTQEAQNIQEYLDEQKTSQSR